MTTTTFQKRYDRQRRQQKLDAIERRREEEREANIKKYGCPDCSDLPCESCYFDNLPLDRSERNLGNLGDLYNVGDTISFEVGAPGIGRTFYEITKIENGDTFGVLVDSTVQILTPAECV